MQRTSCRTCWARTMPPPGSTLMCPRRCSRGGTRRRPSPPASCSQVSQVHSQGRFQGNAGVGVCIALQHVSVETGEAVHIAACVLRDVAYHFEVVVLADAGKQGTLRTWLSASCGLPISQEMNAPAATQTSQNEPVTSQGGALRVAAPAQLRSAKVAKPSLKGDGKGQGTLMGFVSRKSKPATTNVVGAAQSEIAKSASTGTSSRSQQQHAGNGIATGSAGGAGVGAGPSGRSAESLLHSSVSACQAWSDDAATASQPIGGREAGGVVSSSSLAAMSKPSAVAAWKQIQDKMKPPLCKGHREPCVIRTTKKAGGNQGGPPCSRQDLPRTFFA